MTDEQHAHLSRYVRDVADALRLRDLDILLMRDRPEESFRGQSQGVYGQPEIKVWIDPGLAIDRGLMRETVIHELLHAHFNPMRDLFLHVYNGEPTGEDVPAVFYRSFKERWEFCLDTTARIVAPFLPLIDPFPEG